MAESPTILISQAFARQPELGRKIMRTIATTPEHKDLFCSIAQYILATPGDAEADSEQNPRPSKRPRTNNDTLGGSASGADVAPVLLSVADVSFTSPQRKKLLLEVTAGGLRGKVPGTGAGVFSVPWDEIQHAVCVPVPDKAQRQYNFCVFPRNGDGVSVPPGHPAAVDAIVWTVPDGPAEQASGQLATVEHGTYKALLTAALNARLSRGIKLVEPNEREFASALVQAHRKGEKAMHVKGFRGSKDGYLYFLPTGILWAFKKPLLFFAFASISSVSYTSVLQRTFNLVIATPPPADPDGPADAPEAEPVEHEFSMIDQEDFAGIDAYVKKHALHDASMAEARRAQGTQGAKSQSGGTQANGQTSEDQENAAAEEGEDEDEEDEEGEDYDPGSEGESEGSGTDTSEDENGPAQEDDPDLDSDLCSDDSNAPWQQKRKAAGLPTHHRLDD